MDKPRVYIETTIPSFYVEIRTDPQSVARREWTRRWWDHHREEYEVVTSDAVLDELTNADYPTRAEALAFMKGIPVLVIVPAVTAAVAHYLRLNLMPQDPAGDALHLAFAFFYECDFLLTWNCRHLANANKFRRIQEVNNLLGLYVPVVAPPNEMLGEDA